jgi:hypothetical protein
MSIYLGREGYVQLTRIAETDEYVRGVLTPNDVNVSERRFSFSFSTSAFITGDRIELGTQDLSNLVLIQNHSFPDALVYVNVDDAGGIRLFDTFEQAVNGDINDALPLERDTGNQNIRARTRDPGLNFISQVYKYEITTSRDSVDVTALGKSFRENYSNGLISGQGSLSCFWEYKNTLGDDKVGGKDEVPNYMAKLLLRLKQGSVFRGRFVIFDDKRGHKIFYSMRCVVTNVAIQAGTRDEIIETEINFVTSGPISLKVSQDFGSLLLEDSSKLLAEDSTQILGDPEAP